MGWGYAVGWTVISPVLAGGLALDEDVDEVVEADERGSTGGGG